MSDTLRDEIAETILDATDYECRHGVNAEWAAAKILSIPEIREMRDKLERLKAIEARYWEMKAGCDKALAEMKSDAPPNT